MTIGDILAVIAAILLVAASWGSALILVALAFPSKVAAAERRIVSAPGASFGAGLATLVVVGIVAAVLNKSHAGPVRILAGALLTGLGILAALGSAAIVRLLSDRIQEIGAPMQPFATLTRGAILYVAAGFVPIFGWLLIMPVAACLSVGGGLSALLKPPAPPVAGGLAIPAAAPLPVPGTPPAPGSINQIDPALSVNGSAA